MKARFLKGYRPILSVLLAAALLISSLGVSMIFGSAITVNSDAEKSVVTGFIEDFEGGIGGWTKTSMNYGVNSSGGDVIGFRSNGGAYDDAFATAFNYTSATDSDNKVLAVTKVGAGYTGATSVAIPVSGNTEYTVSAVFKEFSTNKTASNGYYDANTALVIKEFKTADTAITNDLTYKKIASANNSTDWQTLSGSFTTADSTKYIVVYLTVGSQWNVRNTIYFDNVSLTSLGSISVTNGDFESGKAGGDVPDWTKVAIDNNTKKKIDQPSYINAYTVTTEKVDGNKVLSVKKTGAGYIGIASKPVKVAAGVEYTVSFDYILKEYGVSAGETAGNANTKYLGSRLFVEEFDAAGVSLSTDGELSTLYSDHVNAIAADTEWRAARVSYTPSEGAASASFYFYSGGEYKMNSTVYFDNLAVSELKNNKKVYNATFDKVTYKGNGGRADGVAGPNGWNLYSAAQTGAKGSDSYDRNYVATTVEENGNKYVHLEGKNGVTQGYAAFMSPFIAVTPGESFSASFDYKLEGTKDDNDYGSYILFYFFDKDEKYISYYHPTGLDYTKCGQGWQTKFEDHTDMKVPANAAYMTVGFWTGGRWSQTQKIDYYFDNVCIAFDSELEYWTEEPCRESATPYDYPAYKDNYGIRKVADSKDHPEALQLYVSRAAGTGGGVVFYSKPIPVSAGTDYTTAFDSKIENSVAWSTSSNLYGASYVLRWLKADGTELSRKDLTGRRFDNMDWTRYEYDITAPDGAVSVQVGLVIGSYTWGICKDLEYSYDNIVFMTAADYDAENQDPAVYESVLFGKDVLFAGDAIGHALAVEAANYSKMVVTDVCGNTSLKEQLAGLTDTDYSYVVVSVGDAEIKAAIPAGSVTANDILMNGAPFDTATFAGLLEQTFAEVTEYTEPDHIVYVLPTENTAYKAVAEAACRKWGVALSVLSDSTDGAESWQETITPAENAPAFDSFAVAGFADYLADKAEDISNSGLSFEARDTLDEIIEKAEKCPANHTNYSNFQNAADTAKTVIALYSDYAPLMLGATIAENDPNMLRFVAAAPKNTISGGIVVKKMGILVMAKADLSENGAALEIGNSYIKKDITSDYTSPLNAYYGELILNEVDPFAEYVAVSYIVYEENGKAYTLYSESDYHNGFGDETVTDGKCIKSVTGIAKEIAKKLLAEKENEMDFAAIGGAENKAIIETATEKEDLKKIYYLVQDNAELINGILG